VAHRIGKPAVQILADNLVWPNYEMAGVSLPLSFGKPLFDHLTGAATEELLASVRHAQIGDPAAIATGVDRALAEATTRNAFPRQEVDILPSTWPLGNSIYRPNLSWSRVDQRCAVRVLQQPLDERLEVTQRDAARASDADRAQAAAQEVLVEMRSPD